MNYVMHLVCPTVEEFLNLPVFPNGEHKLTLFMALHLIALIAALLYFCQVLRKWLIEGVLNRVHKIDVASRHAIGTISSYVVLSIGLLVILDTAGIDITIITVLAGALGLGASLSLQNIISNFMSGLIILVERPIKVGDRVEVGNVIGEVIDISLRSTTLLTSDNIAIIVPNSEFIGSKVINWSYNNKFVRFRIPISVSRSTDPELVTRALLAIAENEPAILKDPKPEIMFDSFSNSTQDFVLYVWSNDANHPELLKSRLNYAVSRLFRNIELEMPVAQGHIDTVSGFSALPDVTSQVTVERV